MQVVVVVLLLNGSASVGMGTAVSFYQTEHVRPELHTLDRNLDRNYCCLQFNTHTFEPTESLCNLPLILSYYHFGNDGIQYIFQQNAT